MCEAAMAAVRGSNTKPPLERISVFGANGHIGRPLADWMRANSPSTGLKLVMRNEDHRAALATAFPQAEICIANYYDLGSLESALSGVQGAFIVTPDFLDEQRAMTNFVYAARTNPGLRHIVRLIADPPGMTAERVPDSLKAFGGGTAVQHLRAKAILEQSGLPFTYINIAAYFMQNFLTPFFNGPIRAERILSVPRNRRMGFIDTHDIGACAAAILLSGNQRHIGQTYHLDNGHDVLWFDEVASLMSDVFDQTITYDGTDETFLRICGEGVKAYIGRPDADQYYINYFQFEQDNETVWRKSDIVEFLTGRPAKTLRQWLSENKHNILGQ
ncbi:hypothetical protein EUU25_08585 [Sphingorhabdus lacus]|uniref:NmrA-like domain-containing protein n=1 Tax=Sphingorhabdus lacus TaxID=392610 RepID=A0A6I6L8L2_9SPHN|nr:hypothetical protein EUU25_08585 [Sphingorhabdus lacus]